MSKNRAGEAKKIFKTIARLNGKLNENDNQDILERLDEPERSLELENQIQIKSNKEVVIHFIIS